MLPIHAAAPGLLSFLVTTFGLRDVSQGDAPDGASPQDFAPGIEMVSVEPGYFSNAIQKNHLAIHALQVIREDTTSCFILELLPTGEARVCRGWRYLFFNDGPETHSSEQIGEQLGYLGKWHQNDGWAEIVLYLENSVCPQIGEYTNAIPNHSTEWSLRCLQIVLKDHPTFKEPILVGQFIGMRKVLGEDHPHLVCDTSSEDCWLLLGAGNGIRLKEQSKRNDGEASTLITAAYATVQLKSDAWQYSF